MYKGSELIEQAGWKGVDKISDQELQGPGKLANYIQVRPGF